MDMTSAVASDPTRHRIRVHTAWRSRPRLQFAAFASLAAGAVHAAALECTTKTASRRDVHAHRARTTRWAAIALDATRPADGVGRRRDQPRRVRGLGDREDERHPVRERSRRRGVAAVHRHALRGTRRRRRHRRPTRRDGLGLAGVMVRPGRCSASSRSYRSHFGDRDDLGKQPLALARHGRRRSHAYSRHRVRRSHPRRDRRRRNTTRRNRSTSAALPVCRRPSKRAPRT